MIRSCRYYLKACFTLASFTLVVLHILYSTHPQYHSCTKVNGTTDCLGNSSLLFNHLETNIDELGVFNGEKNLSQDDPLILNLITKHHLLPPSKAPYSLKGKTFNKLKYEIKVALQSSLFRDKIGGFFVEVGAKDGQFGSTTIELEITRSWSGLLIEPSPSLFQKLQDTHRKAWTSNVCLSGHQPEKIQFFDREVYANANGIKPSDEKGNGMNSNRKYDTPVKISENEPRSLIPKIVNCFPLYSLLCALNKTYVDFLSLSLHGDEYKVLYDLPLNLIYIKVIMVEFQQGAEGQEALVNLLLSKWYKLLFETESGLFFATMDNRLMR